MGSHFLVVKRMESRPFRAKGTRRSTIVSPFFDSIGRLVITSVVLGCFLVTSPKIGKAPCGWVVLYETATSDPRYDMPVNLVPSRSIESGSQPTEVSIRSAEEANVVDGGVHALQDAVDKLTGVASKGASTGGTAFEGRYHNEEKLTAAPRRTENTNKAAAAIVTERAVFSGRQGDEGGQRHEHKGKKEKKEGRRKSEKEGQEEEGRGRGGKTESDDGSEASYDEEFDDDDDEDEKEVSANLRLDEGTSGTLSGGALVEEVTKTTTFASKRRDDGFTGGSGVHASNSAEAFNGKAEGEGVNLAAGCSHSTRGAAGDVDEDKDDSTEGCRSSRTYAISEVPVYLAGGTEVKNLVLPNDGLLKSACQWLRQAKFRFCKDLRVRDRKRFHPCCYRRQYFQSHQSPLFAPLNRGEG